MRRCWILRLRINMINTVEVEWEEWKIPKSRKPDDSYGDPPDALDMGKAWTRP